MNQVKTGQFIFELRKERGLTQKQLADAIGVSDKTVSKWENGNGMPDTGILVPLSLELNVTVNELLSGEKISAENYSSKADDNILTLLDEKKKYEKSSLIKGIAGCLLIVLCIFLVFINILDIGWFFDLPSLFLFVVLCVAAVLLSGQRGKKNIIAFSRKIVIPVGASLSLIGLISSLGAINDLEKLGSGIFISLITLLYAVVSYIVLAILEKGEN